jgi:hypothetical protein
VTRDGNEYAAWRALGPDVIEVETRIGSHRYEIWTGHLGGAAVRAQPERAGAQDATSARAAAPREPTRPIEIASALAAAGAGGCPCCAGASA